MMPTPTPIQTRAFPPLLLLLALLFTLWLAISPARPGIGNTPAILLVDDDTNNPDVRSAYTSALDALGLSWAVRDMAQQPDDPTADDLAPYQMVIWFTGNKLTSLHTGPGPAGEAALATWLDDGNCLFLSSQDYLWARGLTGFAQSRLGVAGYINDVAQNEVTGSGAFLGGLGPYPLQYPFVNWSDTLTPDSTAQLAFVGNAGGAAVSKETESYRTTFWAFPFEALPENGRTETLAALVNWCGVGDDFGTLSGSVSDSGSGAPLAGAKVVAGSRTATTAADGSYSMQIAAGSYTVTASAPGYHAWTAAAVVVTAGAVTTQDFGLQGAVLTFSPPELAVTMTLGEVLTRTVTLTNTGPLPLAWETLIRNWTGPDGSGPQVVPLSVTPLQPKSADSPSSPSIPADSPLRLQNHDPVPAGRGSHSGTQSAEVSLILDDGSRENGIGIGDGGQFFWFNRFTPDPDSFPFVLEEIHVLFSQYDGVAAGDLIDLFVYEDSDGDGNPATSARFVGSILNATVRVADNSTWSIYQPAEPLVLNGPGDVLIGVVNRTAGVLPGQYPAAVDTHSSANRSWIAVYVNATPGNPPALPPYGILGTIDSYGMPGNWMIRGYGQFGDANNRWAAASPPSGTIPPDSSATFALVFDTTALFQSGTFSADLTFLGSLVNDPPVLPLTLTVGCAACGFLAGSLTDSRTGDPVHGTITITGPDGFELLLGGSSYGNIVVQPGSYTISVSASGYFSQSATVVVESAEMVVTDFALIARYGELLYSPAAVERFISAGERVTTTVTVTNSGTIPLDFEARIRNYEGPELLLRPVAVSIPAFTGELSADAAPLSSGLPPAASAAAAANASPLLNVPGGPPALAINTFPGYNLVALPDVRNPDSWQTVVPLPHLYNAADFLNGDFSRLYAIDYNNYQLVTLDTETGLRTPIGTIFTNQGHWTGMTGAPDGTLYAVSSRCGGDIRSTLYQIDPLTSAPTEIGLIGAGLCIVDIAINSRGVIYGVDINTNQLYRIDRDTGAGEAVGSLGINANYVQGLDFDDQTDILYWAAWSTFGEMRVIDTTTGASAPLGVFPGGTTSLSALAIATVDGVREWASASPAQATVPAGATVTFELLFDASALVQDGRYTAELRFFGDYENEPPAMPLTMHLDCPACGFVTGQIRDALTGEPVSADIRADNGSGIRATTFGDSFRFSLPAGEYGLSVSADNYFDSDLSFTLTPGLTVTLDVDLVPVFGELQYAPDALSATLPWGATITETFVISNTGTTPFTFGLGTRAPEGSGSAAAGTFSSTICPPDDFGYTCADSNAFGRPVIYAFDDISAGGTLLPLADDAISGPLPIGFPFNFYGTDYETIHVAANGFLTVLPGQWSGCCNGQSLPDPSAPNGVIAGWWEDLNPGISGTIHYETVGFAPNRVFIVQFSDVPHWPNTAPVTLQFKLFEGSHNIEIHYAAAPSDGGLHSVGIENQDGTSGLQYALTNDGLITPLAVCFLYPGQTACGHANETRWLSLDPVSGTVAPGETQTIQVILDSSVITATGSYPAEIVFSGDFANAPAPLPVTINPVEPEVSLTFSVTVNDQPDCGASNTVTVPAGSSVYYCYTVHNSGQIPLPRHTISDTVLGHVASFIYTLQPGETEALIVPHTISAETRSTIHWHAANSWVGQNIVASDSVEVLISEEAVIVPARLRVAHLAPFAPTAATAVTVTLNGIPRLTDFAWGDSTTWLELVPNDYLIEITPAGSATPLITANATLVSGTWYSAVAIGDGTNQPPGLLLLVDDTTPPAEGQFHLRLGHVAPFAPGAASADIRLQGGKAILEGVAFGDVSGTLPLPAESYDLIVTAPGGAPILIDPLPVPFAAGQIITAFATGDGTNQPAGIFAWPADAPGFFLPLADPDPDPDPVFTLWLPLVMR
jgi:uncharacterized membrane protein